MYRYPYYDGHTDDHDAHVWQWFISRPFHAAQWEIKKATLQENEKKKVENKR